MAEAQGPDKSSPVTKDSSVEDAIGVIATQAVRPGGPLAKALVALLPILGGALGGAVGGVGASSGAVETKTSVEVLGKKFDALVESTEKRQAKVAEDLSAIRQDQVTTAASTKAERHEERMRANETAIAELRLEVELLKKSGGK